MTVRDTVGHNMTDEEKRKKRYAHLRKWKPGESGNPAGGRKHDKHFKEMKRLTKQKLAELIEVVLMNGKPALQRILKEDQDKECVLKIWLASAAVTGIRKGDLYPLEWIVSRVVGKVKDEVHHSGEISAPVQVVVSMPPNGRDIKPET